VRGVRSQVISPKIVLKVESVRPAMYTVITLANVPLPGRSVPPLPLPPLVYVIDDSTVNCAIQGDFINGLVRA
jgi:hypothetical protein